MKPNFESPVHTARDMVERNITLYYPNTAQIWKQMMSKSDIPEYRKIAESIVFTESWDQFDEITKNELLSKGTHAFCAPYLYPYELAWAREYIQDQGRYKYNSGRGFYKGEEVVLAGVLPEAGYLTNKKWHLNEVDLLTFNDILNYLK